MRIALLHNVVGPRGGQRIGCCRTDSRREPGNTPACSGDPIPGVDGCRSPQAHQCEGAHDTTADEIGGRWWLRQKQGCTSSSWRGR
jgi:hypothetical protein